MLRKLLSSLRYVFSKRQPQKKLPSVPPPQGGTPGQTVSEKDVRERLEGLGYIE